MDYNPQHYNHPRYKYNNNSLLITVAVDIGVKLNLVLVPYSISLA